MSKEPKPLGAAQTRAEKRVEEANPITFPEALVLARAQSVARAYDRADLRDPEAIHGLMYWVRELNKAVNQMIPTREDTK